MVASLVHNEFSYSLLWRSCQYTVMVVKQPRKASYFRMSRSVRRLCRIVTYRGSMNWTNLHVCQTQGACSRTFVEIFGAKHFCHLYNRFWKRLNRKDRSVSVYTEWHRGVGMMIEIQCIMYPSLEIVQPIMTHVHKVEWNWSNSSILTVYTSVEYKRE